MQHRCAHHQHARFQLTAARRRLVFYTLQNTFNQAVSTHSRPKAAGFALAALRGNGLFQLTAARRRLALKDGATTLQTPFQLTAARRRLGNSKRTNSRLMRFNSQPPEGGWF